MAERKNEYRRLARECLSLAQTTSGEESRLTLFEMARVWTRLADELDVPFQLAAVVGQQPVVQQQQQVQPHKDGTELNKESAPQRTTQKPGGDDPLTNSANSISLRST